MVWLLLGSGWMILGVVGLLRRQQGLRAQKPLLRFLRRFRLARSDDYYERLGVVVPLGFIVVGFVSIVVSLIMLR